MTSKIQRYLILHFSFITVHIHIEVVQHFPTQENALFMFDKPSRNLMQLTLDP